jgi:glyoxylase-like metal-dependent hydrolase (beta-lactamase superfamily II)
MAESLIPFELGLHEVADGCHAYLQPDGGWGYSNAGLVVGDGASLLVDTLFDLDLTASMLSAMAGATSSAPIGTVVNTHANGDHCYGNQLVADREIIASRATADEMHHVPAAMMAQLNAAPGDVGELFRSFFGNFRFDGIELIPPSRTFEGRLELEIGGRAVELIEVGPAHTNGDTVVVVPDSRTVFTGDIVFIGGAPIVWAGPLENWIAACDLMLGLDVETVVPGHGPVTDKSGVVAVRDYLTTVLGAARECHANGIDAFDAAWLIVREMQGVDATRDLREFGRMAVNVDTVYRSTDATHETPNVVEQFRRMAEIEARAARG